ncbi:STE20-related kinase adapter protein alpha-like [Oppia nitens]|uniref:STE20-related kinase adapter protein alpha-like n=1 Tax=Oppia nitens TaxID=1686743 RepID=UPI0023DCD6F4|nr:STE20-related kinase adapter protein alpha-like [Oppia nitens]
MNTFIHKSNSKSSFGAIVEQRLESLPQLYECVNQMKTSDDHFIVKYIPNGDKYALRRTNLEMVNNIEFVVNEIKSTCLLKHKNLLPILCSFVRDFQLWTITPLAAYGSASDLSKTKTFSELAIAFIVRDVLSALVYLHKRGIIHRSVRGSHILVTAPDGRCLLSGLKHSTSCMNDGKWQTAIHEYPTNAKPNLIWLAPEILEQNLLGYNAKSDIYSLGITICELANTCIPFQDVELTEMLLDKLTAHYPRPLDSTCDEIRDLEIDEMSEEIRHKYEIYKNRTFSPSFHKFTIDCCLNFDPSLRPTASQLLDHSFVKQIKKSSHNNLLSLLPNVQPVNSIQNNVNGDSISSEDSVNKVSSCDESINDWIFS